jgi:uncharacterized protein (DUF983 family)
MTGPSLVYNAEYEKWRVRFATAEHAALAAFIAMNGRPKRGCPNCHDTRMVELLSTKTKICPSCATEVPWPLDPGQKPVWEGT